MDFETVAVPDVPTMVDEPPPMSDAQCHHANAAGVQCLKESGHEGRHRFKETKNSGSEPRGGGNDKLAVRAADVLLQLHSVIGTGTFVLGFPKTAAGMAAADDSFRESLVSALALDPKMCRFILRGGANSAKVALILAYVGYSAKVVPYFMMEMQEKRDATGTENYGAA